jgi:nucleoside-diphosphate-sugar epimerase
MRSLVIGATGLVGSHIVKGLIALGEHPIGLSRSVHESADIDWYIGDLEKSDVPYDLPSVDILYCTAHATLLAGALPRLIHPALKRIVVLSSTSIFTKSDSENEAERKKVRRLIEAEQKIVAVCKQNGVEWTILRPTIIYGDGRDGNITPLSKVINRFGFMPLVGGGMGLRQPVHAQDVANGAIAAAQSSLAANKIYSLPGGEIITYREMIGRIFDALHRPRRMISVPRMIWRLMFAIGRSFFPNSNSAMGLRMEKDMTFDSSSAVSDFGWHPRSFNPTFD